MKKVIAILSLTMAAMSFAAPSYSADVKNVKQEVSKPVKESAKPAKKDAKALAKQKKEQQKAAKKAKKHAKKPGKNPSQAHAVPEINGSYAALAICLLAGMVAIRRERYRNA